MKLKIYNAANASRRQGLEKPMISLPKKGGLIYLSKGLVKLMGLKTKDKIAIAQNEQSVFDWYIFKSNEGIAIRTAGENDERMSFNSSLIAEDLRACAPANIDTEKSIKMPVSIEPVRFEKDKTDYWPIITKGAY